MSLGKEMLNRVLRGDTEFVLRDQVERVTPQETTGNTIQRKLCKEAARRRDADEC